MKVIINAATLHMLCAPHFTFEACEAIESYINECCPNIVLTVGDIYSAFSEIPAKDTYDFSNEEILAELDNGNIVIFNN